MAEDGLGEVAEQQWAQGGDIAADVVAERGSGAAQARWKQFGEVNRVAAEQRDLEEAHDGHHPENVAKAVEHPEGERRADEGHDKGDGEGGLATNAMRQLGKEVNAEERSDVEQQAVDAGPQREST